MLSYVEGPSSFKLANKSEPRLHRRYVTTAVLRFSLSFVRISPSSSLLPSLPPPQRYGPRYERTQCAPSGSRRGLLIFHHARCARASSLSPSFRLLQVARNSLQPLSSRSLPFFLFFSSYLSIRPSVRRGRARCENIGSFAR